MKTLVYAVSFALLLLSSCTKEDSGVVSPNEISNSAGKIVETGSINPKTKFPFMTNYDLAAKAKSVNNGSSRLGISTSNAVYGPFTVSGNLRLVTPNRKTLLTSNQSVYPYGIYFCDIYICEYIFTLPSGAYFSLDSASKFGYDNFSEQTIGVQYTQTLKPSGKQYTIYTYSIVPNTDTQGRFIYNGTIPTDLTGTTFTYSYQL